MTAAGTSRPAPRDYGQVQIGNRRQVGRARRTGSSPLPADEWLTVEEICEELKISRRTFDRWRARGTGPRCVPLGGHGPLRTRRSWLDAWTENGPDAA
jgi:predicted DNA-binding transcriptional regulator AlpA